MPIRTATLKDLDRIHQIEAASFPPEEAASYERLAERLRAFPDYFWVLEEQFQNVPEPVITGIINGMVTNLDKIQDPMFETAALHDRSGAWQTVFGLAVDPRYRNRGYATRLLNHLITTSTANGKRGVTLTCKDHLVHYYQKFGFTDAGISQSQHGGVLWHDMILKL